MHHPRLDAAIAATLVVAAAWQGVAAAGREGARPWPSVVLFLAVGAALALGLSAGRRLSFLLPAVVTLGILAVLLASPEALRGVANAGPLGYANADAALGVQGVTAGCIALVGARGRARPATGLLVVALCVVTVLIRSAAAAALLVGVLAVTGWVLVRRTTPTRTVATVAAVLVLAAVVTTAIAGATYHVARGNTLDDLAQRAVTARRVALWHDAVELMADHPLRGVGPQRFPRESPTARRDADTRQAHSAFLQSGAEGGVPALLLLVAVIGLVLTRLAATRGTAQAVVGAAGVGALAVHASIDYVLQFPSLVVLAALVAGVAAGSGPSAGKPGLTPPSP